MDHTNYETDRSSKTVNIGSHIPDVIGGDSSLGALTCPQCSAFMCIPKKELEEDQECPYCNCSFSAEQDKQYKDVYNTKIITL